MPDDGTDMWRQETESTGPPTPPPPPSPRSGYPGSARRRSERPFWPESALRRAGYPVAAEALTASVAGAGMLLVLLAHGWPPPVDPVASPQLLLPVLVPALFAALVNMARLHVALTGGIAALVSIVIYMIVVPAWGVFRFAECWTSWLSNC